ncbi:MAG: hypothetical protein ACKN9V_07125 [Pseudomonadota bacterium]
MKFLGKHFSFLLVIFSLGSGAIAVEGVDEVTTRLANAGAGLRTALTGISREAALAIIDRGETVPGISSERVQQITGLATQVQALSVQFNPDYTSADLIKEWHPESRSEGEGKRSGETETPEEKEAREAAEKRAAKNAARDREGLRTLEQEGDRQRLIEQLAAAQQGGQGGRGRSGGQDNGGNSQGGSPSFPPSNNNNDDDSQNQFSNGFDRLANRLSNLGNQGFGNFSSSQNSSKKDEPKKSEFSLPPSKSKSSDDLNLDSKPKPSSVLPQLATSNQSLDTGKPNSFGIEGTPLSPASLNAGSVNSANQGFSGNGFNNNGNNPMMGGMLGGQTGPNQASLGSFGGDFPFDITGESYDPEADSEIGPRFRVYDVSMSGSSSGGSDGASSGDASVSYDLSLKKAGVSQFLYFVSPEEQSLKGVPGIFRSLAAGYKKTRIQLLCSLKDGKKIGLCEKVRSDLDD